MSIFQIDSNKYAIGEKGKQAKYVVKATGRVGHGGKVVGVRGIRPLLDERFKIVKVAKEIAEVLQANA